MLLALFITLYLISGVVGYGACMGDFRGSYDYFRPGQLYVLAAAVGLLGPAGLVVALICITAINGRPFAKGLVYRPGRFF